MKNNKVSVNTVVIASVVSALVVGAAGFFVGKSGNVKYVSSLKDSDSIVAEVKQGNVTADQLYSMLKDQFGNDTLINMIDQLILNDLAPVTDDMTEKLDANIDQLKEQYGDQFNNVLIANGFSDEQQYRDIVLVSYQREAYVTEQVKGLVTDKDIQDLYDSKTPEIRASHILIKPESNSDEDMKKAEDLAKEIITKLDNGEDFAALAKEYSSDTGSAENGGDLDFFGKGDMVAEFEEAAFALNKDEYSKEPVKSQFGYHIILKTDEESKESLEDTKDELIDELVQTKLSEDDTLYTSLLDTMRNENGFKFTDEQLKDNYDKYNKALEELNKEQ